MQRLPAAFDRGDQGIVTFDAKDGFLLAGETEIRAILDTLDAEMAHARNSERSFR
jgi:hypothetical protein